MQRNYKYQSCKRCGISFQPNSGSTLFCKSCPRDYQRISQDYKQRLGKLCAMAKSRAKAKNIPFDITQEHLIWLWDQTDGICRLTGQKFDLSKWGLKGQVNPRAPSLDRIIPSKGYTKGNVRLVTYHINVALSDFGTKEFETLISCYNQRSK